MTEFTVKDSGERVNYDSGMVRDTDDGKPRLDLLRPRGVPFEAQFLTRCAAHMTKAAKTKYGARNWEQANSQEELDRYEQSAERHLGQWLSGDREEDHAAAVFFNLLGAETVRWKMEAQAIVERALEAQAAAMSGRLPQRFIVGMDPEAIAAAENHDAEIKRRLVDQMEREIEIAGAADQVLDDRELAELLVREHGWVRPLPFDESNTPDPVFESADLAPYRAERDRFSQGLTASFSLANERSPLPLDVT